MPPHSVVLPLTAEWASSVVADLPGAKTEVHESVMAEVLRVMVQISQSVLYLTFRKSLTFENLWQTKGARISITQRAQDADTKAWTDRLVGCCSPLVLRARLRTTPAVLCTRADACSASMPIHNATHTQHTHNFPHTACDW